MKKAIRRVGPILWVLLLVSALLLPAPMYAENDVMGEIQFEGKSHVEKTSGVWVDGAYVGYLKELKGSKKVLLLPGEHVITVRQDGYQDFHRTNSCPAWTEGGRSRGHGEGPYRTAS
jgi:hypothetical protein